MPPQETTTVEKNQLTRGKLGVWGVIFLVISATAPLTVVVSAAPLSFRVGGIGAPGAMLYCGAVLILFALGFTAMSNHVPNACAFYAYALHGLGKGPGIDLAFVTVFAYIFLCVSFYGFFAHLTMLELASIDLPWWGFSALAIALVALLGVRQVDVGAILLAALVTAEIAILLAISIAVLLMGGPEPISLAGFNPKNIFFSGGVAGLMVIGFGAYLGFESTAIYAEEARRPQRTIPIATYLAVTLLAGFYAFTFWVLTVAFGVDEIIAFATGENFESMIFEASGSYLGS
ncbi:APC family permease [Glutamicibacter sp.]|uniref:APC family permease n=1 Tax=Glutamicibacter sp. TaxID=1931995 RepID=UPI002FE36008